MVRWLIICLLLFAGCPESPKKPKEQLPIAQRMLKYENALRKKKGLPPRTLSPELTKAAQAYADLMARQGRFGHFLDQDPWKRATRAGYQFQALTENIAKGQPSVDTAYGGWRTSPKHWKAVLNKMPDAGYGHAVSVDGDDYWVAMYGKRKR